MMEAARTSETLVNSDQHTRCYNPEDSNLHTHRCENLKSYSVDVNLLRGNYLGAYRSAIKTTQELYCKVATRLPKKQTQRKLSMCSYLVTILRKCGKLKYLKMTVTSQNCVHEEIKSSLKLEMFAIIKLRTHCHLVCYLKCKDENELIRAKVV
jgi:hypothetical protein